MPIFAKRRKIDCYVIEDYADNRVVHSNNVMLTNQRVLSAQRSRRRIGMCAVVFSVCFVVLGLRLSAISFGAPVKASARLAASGNNILRSEILDRNGAILATNLPMTALEVAGKEVWDADEVVRELSGVVHIGDAPSLVRALQNRRYVEVTKNLTPAQQEEIFQLGLPGVRFRPHFKRYYPQRALAAHVIGHTEPGKGGVAGLEAVMDQRDILSPIVSSIDIAAQQIVEQELSASVERYKAKAGWAIVMNVKTGEVISLASFPISTRTILAPLMPIGVAIGPHMTVMNWVLRLKRLQQRQRLTPVLSRKPLFTTRAANIVLRTR